MTRWRISGDTLLIINTVPQTACLAGDRYTHGDMTRSCAVALIFAGRRRRGRTTSTEKRVTRAWAGQHSAAFVFKHRSSAACAAPRHFSCISALCSVRTGDAGAVIVGRDSRCAHLCYRGAGASGHWRAVGICRVRRRLHRCHRLPPALAKLFLSADAGCCFSLYRCLYRCSPRTVLSLLPATQ